MPFVIHNVCKPLWGPNYFTLQYVCKPLWGPNYLSFVLVVVVDVGVSDGGGHMGVGGGSEGLFVVLLYGQRAGDGLGSGSGLIPGWVWVCELPRPRPGLSSGSCMLSCLADAWAELKVCEPPRQEPGLSSGPMGVKGRGGGSGSGEGGGSSGSR